MKYTMTLQEDHLNELKKTLLQPDGKERVAILLCGSAEIKDDPWDGGSEFRFLSKQIIVVDEQDILLNTEHLVNWDTKTLRKAMKIAKEQELQLCLVHSHPPGSYKFSEIDDQNERELFKIMYSRNSGHKPHMSLIITQDEVLVARACTSNLVYYPIDFIRTIGNRYHFYYPNKSSFLAREEFNRQQLAFGPSLGADLSKLRIGIVGCGATGSATAHLLARLGVGQLLLMDKDIIERSNLSRLHGPNSANADIGSNKAKAMASFISGIGIGCRVRYLVNWVSDEDCRDAMKNCDVVFGCTDDNSGRIVLNRFSAFYLIPVIDMGIVIDPPKGGSSIMEALQARVTVLQPENTCLICRKVVDLKLAREEQLKRGNPEGFIRQKEEAYVTGEQNPSPAVITFTTEVATMAVNEFLNRITGFKSVGAEKHIVRFFDKSIDRHPNVPPNPDCPVCGSDEYWGKGDIYPFLDIVC
jgi:molybdopterin/thiamine biosynthesis adenylyltransferase